MYITPAGGGGGGPRRGAPRGLVLPDRLERGAGHAAVHPPPDPEPHEPHPERDQVEDSLVGELDRPGVEGAGVLQREPQRAAGPVALGDDEEADHLAQRQRHEGEVMAHDAEAEAGVAQDQREEDGRPHGQRRGEPGGDAPEVPEERRRVRPHAQKGAVAERDQAEPAHQRPRGAHDAPDQDEDGDVQDVEARRPERQPGEDRQESEAEKGEEPLHSRFPRIPSGRTKIATMKMTKATTYAISVEVMMPPTEITSLMRRLATTAPNMFPSPPRTQIMNVSGPKAAPKGGCTEY